MKHYWLTLIGSCLLLAGSSPKAPPAFNLTPPIRLVATSMYADGGTTYFVLADSKGETLRGGFDGQETRAR